MIRCGGKQKTRDELSLWEQGWVSLWARFPERRIYVRTDGRVRSFVFGRRLQIVAAAFSLLILAWTAFTSANVLVAHRIIAIERLRWDQTQALYAAQIERIHDLQAKQNSLAAIIEHREKIDSALRLPSNRVGGDAATSSSDETAAATAPRPQDYAGIAPAAPNAEPRAGELPRDARQTAPARQRDAAPAQPEGFLRRAVETITNLFSLKRGAPGAEDRPAPIAMQPEQNWLAALDHKQLVLLRKLTEDLENENRRLGRTLESMGIMPERFMGLPSPVAAEPRPILAGAVLPLESFVQTDEDEYAAELANASDSLDELAYAVGRMNAVPWVRPTDVDYGISSGFGVRRDPFTRRRAFHSGLDLSGPRGSLVRATAPGIVIYAARNGAYGNTVEIDHGSGIRTRYGHLRSISVRRGAAVIQGTPVGRLGSTGRSTGPHVHYEVWYGNAPKDPRAFIETGQILLPP